MALILKFEGMAGDDIDNTADELCALATRLSVITNMKFNGVDLNAKPNSTPKDLVDGYHRIIKMDDKYPMVWAHNK